jgi:hypothetical protein
MQAIDRENRNNAMTTDKRLKKKSSSFQPLKLAIQVGLICGLAVTGISGSIAGDRERAKRMHDRLAGIPPTEEQALSSRGEDYREYQRTTSAFVPWFPKKRTS